MGFCLGWASLLRAILVWAVQVQGGSDSYAFVCLLGTSLSILCACFSIVQLAAVLDPE